MRPMKFVRRKLDLTQAGLAEVVGVRQGTISRWETEDTAVALEPSRSELAAIREYAAAKGIRLRDSWFFQVPTGQAGRAA